MLDLVWFG